VADGRRLLLWIGAADRRTDSDLGSWSLAFSGLPAG